MYYRAASRWLGQGLLTWDRAPLYVLTIGFARKFVDDATLLVPVHRALATLALALGGLAFFRRMLPAPIALCVAAWAAFVPTQFDGLYEIHLVGAALAALAAWLATYGARRSARGAVLALLVISTLVRSELAAAAVVWGLACGVHEWRRPHGEATHSMTILRPYLIPVVTIVLTLAIGFGVGAWAPRFRTPKTTRHFCNAYALGVAEREHLPRYASWSNCRPILARDFGRTDVGPLRAAVASPRALFRHFTWNLRLLSRSIELMLWGATGAAEGSDYYPVPAGSRAARVATIVLAVAVAAAYRHAPAPLDPEAATRRHWGFAGVGGLLAPSLVVLFASRARAPYLAPVGLAAFLLVGLAIERLWRGARSRGAELAAIAVVAAALPFVPPRYDAQYATPMSGPGQPIMTAVRRLSAHRAELASPSVRLASAVRPMALCAYLSTAAGWCEEVSAKWMRAVDDPAAFDAALRAIGTTHAYLDETLPRQAAEALERADLGWTRVGPPGRDEPWVLLRAGVRPAR